MHIKLNRALVVLGGAAALAAPATAVAKQDGKGHGPDRAAVKAPKAPKTKMKTVVLKGLVASVDGTNVTVTVKHSNSHGRALRDQDVLLDLSAARVSVRDANADGERNVSDVAAGDRVVAQVKIPRGTAFDAAQALATRRFVDVGPKPVEPEDDESGETDES
jgi:hypothetical protein